MYAQVLYGPKDLRYEEVETPVCPSDGVLVKTIACGICASDLRTYNGGTASAIYPSISGHEIAAEVIESNYERFPAGTKLCIAPVIACGSCWYCKRGYGNQCDNLKMIGIAAGIPGGFGEYIAFDQYMLDHGCFNVIPDGANAVQTTLAETASSVLNAQINANVVMEDLVVIVGSGAIGCLHSEVAKIRGTKETLIVEVNPEKAEMARQRGFSTVVTYNSGDQELKNLIMEKTEGRGADTVICACPVGQVQADALELVRKKGKVIFFGGIDMKKPAILNTNLIHYKEITVHGANAYSPEVNKQALDLILSGRLNAEQFITNTYELKDLEAGYINLTEGKSLKNVIVY
jgi:Threonine dehydrogenase and related Zn-dependent dehydrogenases